MPPGPPLPPSVQRLRENEIQDLKEIRAVVETALLIAIDIEGPPHHINEAGIAVADCKAFPNGFRLTQDRRSESFFKHNKPLITTIEVESKLGYHRYRQRWKPGDTVLVPDAEAANTLQTIVEEACRDKSRQPILVVYGGATEFQYMALECPDLATQFSSWIDVQVLLQKTESLPRPTSLYNATRGYNLRAHYRCHRRSHRAAKDILRIFVVLAALVSGERFDVDLIPKEIGIFRSIPKPFTKGSYTARITSSDGTKLPLSVNSPRSLGALLVEFGHSPLAVAFNTSGYRVSGGIRIWWASFATGEELDDLKSDILRRQMVDGRTYRVESMVYINPYKKVGGSDSAGV